jgi:hypothetical protein
MPVNIAENVASRSCQMSRLQIAGRLIASKMRQTSCYCPGYVATKLQFGRIKGASMGIKFGGFFPLNLNLLAFFLAFFSPFFSAACLHPTCLLAPCLPAGLHPTCLPPSCLHPAAVLPTYLSPPYNFPPCNFPACTLPPSCLQISTCTLLPSCLQVLPTIFLLAPCRPHYKGIGP